MSGESLPDEQRIIQLHLGWALLNLFLAVIGVGVTLWGFLEDRTLHGEIADLTAERQQACRKIIVSDAPPIMDQTTAAPPQDKPKSGYIGRSGTAILQALVVKLETLRAGSPDGRIEMVRFGSPEVLPPRTIHVVNLWATWCPSCVDELPDLKAMFARRSDWAGEVRFVPVQVKDASAPAVAYSDIQDSLPRAPFWLADRGLGDPFVTALSADEQTKLFRGDLPVTLILDCNRRVRWAQFEALSSVDLTELEAYVDHFREELDDTSPGAWCSQVWPGNGRCEGNEALAGPQHSLEDCGEARRRTTDVTPTTPPPVVELPLPPPVECPPDTIRTATGKCTRKLRGPLSTPKTTTKPTECGNGTCDRGETHSTCCRDCLCPNPLICKSTRDGSQMCMVKGLKM